MRVPRLSSPAARRMFFLSAPRQRRSLLKLGVSLWVATALLGCAQEPLTHFASKEYFPASIYGPASQRVIADGQPVPHGGGQYLVGRPYTVAGRVYVPHVMSQSFSQVGTASWYGGAFHGRRTANGEIYDMNGITAAHPTMPLPSYARVTNLRNGRSIIVRVNDRGPYHPGRVIDVSSRVADLLDFKRFGMAKVRVDYVGPASIAGSSNRQLMATLTTNGQPATLAGAPTMFASNAITAPLKALIGKARAVIAPTRPPPRIEPAAIAMAPRAPAIAPIRAAYSPTLAPLPPRRPLDLGTIPGAGVPIGAPRPLPRSAALFYGSERKLRHRMNADPPSGEGFEPAWAIRASALSK